MAYSYLDVSNGYNAGSLKQAIIPALVIMMKDLSVMDLPERRPLVGYMSDQGPHAKVTQV